MSSAANLPSAPRPPPLPLPAKTNEGTIKTRPSHVRQVVPAAHVKIESIQQECAWALQHPELHFACQRFRICLSREPFKFRYRSFRSILQNGPTCGIVAISMLVNNYRVGNLLQTAIDRRYSMYGELFSVKDACNLLLEAAQDLKTDFRAESKSGNLFDSDVISQLLEGCVLLVPYDSDRNHSPCLKLGHKAHWAIITGIIIIEGDMRDGGYDPDAVYVTAKQGKSVHLGIWKLKDLEASNNNLVEVAPQRQDYVLPPGGIGGSSGLKGQYILINYM